MRPVPPSHLPPAPTLANTGTHATLPSVASASRPPHPDQMPSVDTQQVHSSSPPSDRGCSTASQPPRRPLWAQQGDWGDTKQGSTSPLSDSPTTASLVNSPARPTILRCDRSNQPSPIDSDFEELDFPFAVSADTADLDLVDIDAEDNWWETHTDAAKLLEQLLTEPDDGPEADKRVNFDLTRNRTIEVSRHIARDREMEQPQTVAASIQKALAELDEAKEEMGEVRKFIEDLVRRNTHQGGSITKHPDYPQIHSAMDMAYIATKNCEDTVPFLRTAQETSNYSDITQLTAKIARASATVAADSATTAKLLITAFEHEQNSETQLINLRSIVSVCRGLLKERGLAKYYSEQLNSVQNRQIEQREPATESATQAAYAAHAYASMASGRLILLCKKTTQLVSKHRDVKFSNSEMTAAHQTIDRVHDSTRVADPLAGAKRPAPGSETRK